MTTGIPLHELDTGESAPVRVDLIVPVGGPVHNDVHRHGYDELFFFASGAGTHMIDLQQHPVVAPSMHLVSAGQVHQLSRSAEMRAVVVDISGTRYPDSGNRPTGRRSRRPVPFPA